MSGGFGIIVGYIFAFLVLISVFLGALNTYNEQISEQQKILDSAKSKMSSNLNYDYDFLLPYYSSGRISFILNNGQEKIVYKDSSDNYCFNFFVNSTFVSPQTNLIVNFDDKSLTQNYKFVPDNSDAIFSLKNYINTSNEYTIKTISCEGVEKVYVINSANIDWWNSSFEKRKKITINNSASSGINDYQVPILLNSSNFDFTQGRESEIRFALPIKESYVLDLPFDDSSQTQSEYSDILKTAYLGSGVGVEASDPSFTQSGIILGALDFDGSNDLVTISSNTLLQMNNSVTYSAWVKWDGSGNTYQTIFANGAINNSIKIINDGGVNDNKALFELNISGTVRSLISNTTTIDSNWHLITGTYDGYNMKLYVDTTLVNSSTYLGNIVGIYSTNYVGSTGTSNYFNGTIDEVKILNFALNSSEVTQLYYNNLKFKSLDFYVSNWNVATNSAKVFVKVPYVHPSSNVTFDMYYYSKENISSASDIETTFSYDAPRTVGYVVSGRADVNVGLIISSLYNNNVIYVGSNAPIYLNHSSSSTLAAANTLANDTIKMKYLAQIEGNGQGGDIIVPISFAGREFSTTLMASNPDRICFIAPFADAVTSIYSNNVLIANLAVTRNSNGLCDSRDLVTANNIRITSTMPVLAFYSGVATFTTDGRALVPASSEDWFGVASASFYATSYSSSTTTWYDSNGASGILALTNINTGSRVAQGNQGSAPAFRLANTNKIGAQQYRDSDGTEQSTFAPLTELGRRFGSPNAVDYVAVASPYSNANCTVYSSADAVVQNIVNGVGQNGIYKYSFSTNDGSVQLTAANWYMKCDKAVWPYYDTMAAANTQEKNLFGHLQMRQYIYPEPIISIS